jgi:hypothetical protein
MRTCQRLGETSFLDPETVERLRRLLVPESTRQMTMFTEHRAAISRLGVLTDGDSAPERELAEAGAVRASEVLTDIQHAPRRMQAHTIPPGGRRRQRPPSPQPSEDPVVDPTPEYFTEWQQPCPSAPPAHG